MAGFASKDMSKNILLIIDPQVDFHPGGSLGVPGMFVTAVVSNVLALWYLSAPSIYYDVYVVC